MFLIFSPQIATDSAEHPPSGPVQVANEISLSTVKKIIKTNDLISWSLQIARGMEFLTSKKVMDGICCLIQLNYLFLKSPPTGSARRFGGPQCPFSRGRNCQSGRFRIGQANEKLRLQEK